MGEPSPYIDEDIFRESSEGRSLHDDANVFYREVMGLTTPIKSTEQPTVVEIQDAISKKVSKTDLRMWTIIYALQLSKKEELWPGAIVAPKNSIGKFWCASKNFTAAAVRYHHAENVNACSQKRKVVVTSDKCEDVRKTKRPKLSLRGKTSKKDTSLKGKRSGSKKWTTTEINLLLHHIDDLLPAGKEMWEQVAVKCLQDDGSWSRVGESCKHKFEKMAFAKQPTGQSDIPLHILRAKNLKEKIMQNEVIGCVYQNDEGISINDDDEELTCEMLSVASLLSENNGVRRPLTKPQKLKEASEDIAQVGKDNLEGAKQLTSALNNMAEALKAPIPSGEIAQHSVSELDATKIREFDSMKQDIANIKGTMAEILSYLKNK